MKRKRSTEPKCPACGRGEPEGARFAKLAETHELDKMCINCRFNKIDSNASSPDGIRADMRESGIPVSRRRAGNARNLRFGLDESDNESPSSVEDLD